MILNSNTVANDYNFANDYDIIVAVAFFSR